MTSNIQLGVWIVYDIITIVIIAGTVYSNSKRGFSKIIVSACGYLLSCVIASSLSNVFAPVFYDSFLKDELTSKLNTVIEEYDAAEEIQKCISDITLGLDISEKDIGKVIQNSTGDSLDKDIYNLINASSSGAVSSVDEVTDGLVRSIDESLKNTFGKEIPESIIKGIINYTNEDKESAFELIKVIYGREKTTEISSYIEENYIRQYAVMFVKIFLFILVFFIMMFIVKIIENMLVKADKIPVIGGLDKLAGGAIGIIESFAFVFILCVLIKFIMLLIDGTPVFFNEDTIEQSKLFRLFYNFDLLG